MSEEHPSFDLAALFFRVDEVRQSQDWSWAELGRTVGSVSVSTIRRLEHADDCEADGMLELCRWLGVAPEVFIETREGRNLPARGDGGVVGVADGRTTAQRLVRRAIDEGVSIASLTRLAEW